MTPNHLANTAIELSYRCAAADAALVYANARIEYRMAYIAWRDARNNGFPKDDVDSLYAAAVHAEADTHIALAALHEACKAVAER